MPRHTINRKEHRLPISFTEQEYRDLERAAQREEISQAEYIRQAVKYFSHDINNCKEVIQK